MVHDPCISGTCAQQWNMCTTAKHVHNSGTSKPINTACSTVLLEKLTGF